MLPSLSHGRDFVHAPTRPDGFSTLAGSPAGTGICLCADHVGLRLHIYSSSPVLSIQSHIAEGPSASQATGNI